MIQRTMREWRAYLKMTKNDIAKKIGVHPSTYATWEEYPENIKIGDTIRIAQAFHCEVNEIDFFEDESTLKLDYEEEVPS